MDGRHFEKEAFRRFGAPVHGAGEGEASSASAVSAATCGDELIASGVFA
jgi:hypothetical protein